MSLENLNSKELFIYSTNRSIKSRYEQDSICKPSMLRKEFFSKVIYYPHKTLLPKNVCKLLLSSILEQYDKETSNLSTSHLVFEKNFLAYLQSSAFFLQFYDELFIHNIDITDIPLQDTYGDYEEHLHILQEVFARYNAFLDSNHLVYKSRKYEILKSWLGNFSRIVLHLDSVLNPYEKEILQKVAEFCEVVICFQTQDKIPHNVLRGDSNDAQLDNIHAHFLQIFDKPLVLKPFTRYEVRYPQGTIISQKPCSTINHHISAKSFFGRIEQVGGIRECIKNWLDRGILPQDIAIVLPDSSFVSYLNALDKEHNFNYAMGKKFNKSALFEAIQKSIIQSPPHNTQELQNIVSKELQTNNPKYTQINEKIMSIMYDYINAQELFPIQNVSESFLQDISDLSLDDNRGGKISVIEVLESRGIELKYVIIPDCNEDKIPSLSTSDMFLTTAIRERLGIPTIYDKRALQIWHYKNLLFNAKEACMLLVESEECAPCMLLNELDITPMPSNVSIFKHTLLPTLYKQESYFAPLGFYFSPSSFNTLLKCPLQYYFKYIASLRAPDEDTKDNATYGNIIHEVLYKAYKPYQGKVIDLQKMKQIKESCLTMLLEKNFDKGDTLSALQEIQIQKMLFEMETFFTKEREYIAQNGAFTLIGLEMKFENFTLYNYVFAGRIDRIQQNQDGSILIIDYKYKKPEKNFEDLALEIYRQYILQQYPNKQVHTSFYFLKHSHKQDEAYQIQQNTQETLFEKFAEIDKEFCHTKKHILAHNKEHYVVEDSQTHNALTSRYGEFEPLGKENKTCRYCDYRTLCGI